MLTVSSSTNRSSVGSAWCQSTLTFRPVIHDGVIKGLGMSSRGCATGHIDPVPLIEKSRASCPGGRSPSFIHQLIIITGLNKLYPWPEDGLRCQQGVKLPLIHPLTHSHCTPVDHRRHCTAFNSRPTVYDNLLYPFFSIHILFVL